MLKEFREFALKGSVVDLAVGFIIGGAFGTVVKSLVDNIIMPPIGLLLGHVDFAGLFINLSGRSYNTIAEAKAAKAPTLNYGLFINDVISFLIVALVVFLLVRAMNRLRRQQEAAPVAEPEPAPNVVLLTEIRDLLKAR